MALTGDFRVATVKFIRGYDKDKEYDFALYDYFTIKENDYVLCFTTYGYNVGKITRIVSQKNMENLLQRKLFVNVILLHMKQEKIFATEWNS